VIAGENAIAVYTWVVGLIQKSEIVSFVLQRKGCDSRKRFIKSSPDGLS
jgi:hypothetical protein